MEEKKEVNNNDKINSPEKDINKKELLNEEEDEYKKKISVSQNSIPKLSLDNEEEKEEIEENKGEKDNEDSNQNSNESKNRSDKKEEDRYSIKKSLREIFYLEDITKFDPNEYIRKYNKKNVDDGKIFFKKRFIKNKIETSEEKINTRATFSVKSSYFDKRRSIQTSYSNFSYNLMNINNPKEKFNYKSEYRKYKEGFLVLVENSIFNFNLKKYEESYKILLKEGLVKSKNEFGEFLLVENGYDKYILGTFLAKQKPPNDKKEIIDGFINSIDLIYQGKNDKINSFLECLRFFLSRLKLPEDSNLILEIMDYFSKCLFNNNKNNKDFVKKYPSINAIYLLISTILALNTMLTRKDIKNMNLIKKDQFIEMNKEIDPEEARDIYEKLEKDPLSMTDNYNENNYKRMAILVKKKEDVGKVKFYRSKTIKNTEYNYINKDKNEINEKSKENIIIDNILEKDIPEVEEENNLGKKDECLKPFKSEIVLNKFKDIEEDNNNNILIDNSDFQPIFSYQQNLESFSDEDKEILSQPTKFEKLITASSHHTKFFMVSDNMQKLIWAKEIETEIDSDKNIKIKKIKGSVHYLMIKDIEDVYNGMHNCNLITEYINLNPEEEKEVNNLITIKATYRIVCIKAYSQERAISWFKALKSLVLLSKKNNQNNQIEIEDKNEQLKKFMKYKVEDIWKENILPYWETYGHFFQYKKQNKINEKNRMKNNEIISKNGLLEGKLTYSLKEKSHFVLDIYKKLNENNNIYYLDYNEFIYLYNIGLPNQIRKKMWTLLIGNPCGISLDLFNYYNGFVVNINFEEFINDYLKNNNIEQSLEKLDEDENNKDIINQIIIDIIEIKKLFSSQIENSFKILSSVYRIVRIITLLRPDICYNKSLVSFSYCFLLVFKDEFVSFKNIFNLICSTNTLQYYIKNDEYINIRVKYFDYLLESRIPKVREHFKNLDISTELFLIPWFENIFSFTFDFKLLKKIIDLYLLNGEYMLFQIGLTIIKIQENDLLNLTIGEIFQNLNKLPAKYKEEAFLEKLFLNNIYDDYAQWKIDCEVGNQKIKLLELIILQNK